MNNAIDFSGFAVLVTAIIVGYGGLVTIFLGFQGKWNKKFNDALDKVAKSGTRSADATIKLVAETRKGNQEAEKRNGHLAEISQQGTDRIINKMDEQSGLLSVSTKKVAMQAENVKVNLKPKEH